MYDFKERGVDLEVEGVRYIEMHHRLAAYSSCEEKNVSQIIHVHLSCSIGMVNDVNNERLENGERYGELYIVHIVLYVFVHVCSRVRVDP